MATVPDNDEIDWESYFSEWAKAPSDTEQKRCDNAVSIVRNAIAKHDSLKSLNTVVFTQGSYRNRVNVRQDSDVDVGVLCDQTFYYDLPNNLTAADLNIEPVRYHYSQFKGDLEQALKEHIGRSAVTRGNKAIKLHETSYHVDADIVPLFEHRQYFEDRGVRYGVSLAPDNGGRIDNYPEHLLKHWPNVPLHYENGVSKNTATGRRFKSIVRIIKKLRNAMDEAGNQSVKRVPSYLIECLVWNVADHQFADTKWLPTVRDVLLIIWDATKEESKEKWMEVDDIKFLFHSSQQWSRAQAHAFADSALNLIGTS